MMSYAILDAFFLAGVAAVVVGALVGARRRISGLWKPLIAGGVGLLALTAVFDNIMIALGLFAYRTGTLTGLTVGLAPVEDFAYPVAAAVLLPVLWRWLRHTDPEPEPEEPR